MIKNRILKITHYLSEKKLLRSNNIEFLKELTFTKFTKYVINAKVFACESFCSLSIVINCKHDCLICPC